MFKKIIVMAYQNVQQAFITIKITILVSTPMHDNILFISQVDFDWSKFLSFISWEKIILKMILFLCVVIVIVVVWISLFSMN